MKKFTTFLLGIITCITMALSFSACGIIFDGTQTDKEDKSYSQILQNVLNSSYYNGLIDDYKDHRNLVGHLQKYDTIPYGFLEDVGYRPSSLKNEFETISTEIYTKEKDNNHLYIAMKVLNEGKMDYYDCYTLKYEITNKEYNEINMLQNGHYIQYPFYIQELSELKTPAVEAQAKISVNAYDKKISVFNNDKTYMGKTFGTNCIFFNISAIDTNLSTAKVYLLYPNKQYTLNCKYTAALDEYYSNDILYDGSLITNLCYNNNFITNQEEFDNAFKSTGENINNLRRGNIEQFELEKEA